MTGTEFDICTESAGAAINSTQSTYRRQPPLWCPASVCISGAHENLRVFSLETLAPSSSRRKIRPGLTNGRVDESKYRDAFTDQQLPAVSMFTGQSD